MGNSIWGWLSCFSLWGVGKSQGIFMIIKCDYVAKGPDTTYKGRGWEARLTSEAWLMIKFVRNIICLSSTPLWKKEERSGLSLKDELGMKCICKRCREGSSSGVSDLLSSSTMPSGIWVLPN